MRILKPSKVIFGDNSTEKEFNELDENDEIKRYTRECLLWNSNTKKVDTKRVCPKVWN